MDSQLLFTLWKFHGPKELGRKLQMRAFPLELLNFPDKTAFREQYQFTYV